MNLIDDKAQRGQRAQLKNIELLIGAPQILIRIHGSEFTSLLLAGYIIKLEGTQEALTFSTDCFQQPTPATNVDWVKVKDLISDTTQKI